MITEGMIIEVKVDNNMGNEEIIEGLEIQEVSEMETIMVMVKTEEICQEIMVVIIDKA